jgi:hypothetical protein
MQATMYRICIRGYLACKTGSAVRVHTCRHRLQDFHHATTAPFPQPAQRPDPSRPQGWTRLGPSCSRRSTAPSPWKDAP